MISRANFILIIMVCLSLSMAPIVACAQPYSGLGHGFGMKKFEEKGRQDMNDLREILFAELDLTTEQQGQLDEIREDQRAAVDKFHEVMNDLKEEMDNELRKIDFDEQKVRLIQDKIKNTQNKAADQQLNGILEVRKILTFEQFKEFDQIHRNFFSR